MPALHGAVLPAAEAACPRGVALVEVTTDPGTDTPAVLARYAQSIGAGWTFATGSPDALTAFWKPFGVELATGDSHVSTLALVDRHGYVRLVYRGVPDVGNDMPPAAGDAARAPKGLHELASGGDGWGAPDVLQALLDDHRPGAGRARRAAGARRRSRSTGTDGASVSLGRPRGQAARHQLLGHYCPPCKAEMPLLQRRVARRAAAQLVLDQRGRQQPGARAIS